jgi:6-phosphogluconolactonase
MAGRTDIHIAQNEKEWADAAATLVYEVGRGAVQNHGRFFLALSGGSTPERLYHRFVNGQSIDRYDWSHSIFFFSDERCVPPNHPDSNFGLANRALFRPLNIDVNHIHRMRGEGPDPELAARDYEELLRTVVGSGRGVWPQLDLVLLGVGNDGHTASLFPGTAAVSERQRWAVVGQAPSGPRIRLSLTLGVINRATVVLFLVTGTAKADIVKAILEPENDADRQLPAALVKPEGGRLIWLLDCPAAAKLTGKQGL